MYTQPAIHQDSAWTQTRILQLTLLYVGRDDNIRIKSPVRRWDWIFYDISTNQSYYDVFLKNINHIKRERYFSIFQKIQDFLFSVQSQFFYMIANYWKWYYCFDIRINLYKVYSSKSAQLQFCRELTNEIICIKINCFLSVSCFSKNYFQFSSHFTKSGKKHWIMHVMIF